MDYKQLSEEEILSLCMREVNDSLAYNDSELSGEREVALELYNGRLPAPTRQGTSKYVSYDVFDVVESLKAQLLETFSGNRKIVRFVPPQAGLSEQTKLATELADYIYNRANAGFKTNRDIIHNALIGRNGVAKVYWEKKEKVIEKAFSGAPIEQIDVLIAEEGVELLEFTEDPIQPNPIGMPVKTASGTIGYIKDISNVRIDVIPPEDFIISSRAVSLKDAKVCGDRCRKSKSDLLAEGYDVDRVEEISIGTSNTWYDSEKDARFDNRGGNFAEGSDLQEQTTEFWVYELYAELDVDGSGVAKLWKITCTENVVLDYEPVDSKPYFDFCPLPLPHSFWGANFVERVEPIQNAKTTITRSILEHTVITNNPRLQVLNGTVKNQRELLDNRLGGVINVTRLDGITPLPQASLNPFAFSVLEMLDSDKEDNTSVSRLSKGMNKDAISKQNSADMVTNLVTLSMQRQKIIARSFAEDFLKPLYIYLIKLVIENASEEMMIEVAGQPLSIDVSNWEEQKNAVVEFHVGYQEDEKEAAQFLSMHAMLSQDPSMQRMYGEQQRYALVKKAFEAKGIYDIESLLADPQKLGQPQPDPMQQLEVKLREHEAEIRERQTRIAEMKAETDRMETLKSLSLEELKVGSDMAATADRIDLDEEKFKHKREMDVFEKEIVRREAEAGDVSASASVTGTVI